jgi:AcrR family transcriptional regulator
VRDILDATLHLVTREGIGALSFAVIAERAGVSRTTLHRRWPTKSVLVRAALLRVLEREIPRHDTGTIRGDLAEFIRGLVADCHRGARGANPSSNAVEACPDPELIALVRLAEDRIQEPILLSVERAIARGELPPGTDPTLVVTPIVATVLHRRARGQDLADAEWVVELVLAGARAGAAVRREGHG